MSRRIRFSRLREASGQTVLEFSLALPLVMLVVFGVTDVSYALLDQHMVSRLSREGSNLISRDVNMDDAVVAMKQMSTGPVNLNANSKIIFSVIKRVATTGAANFDKDVLYQRYAYGTYAAVSQLTTVGTGSFGGPPSYTAVNSDNDTNLRLTNLPSDLLVTGGLLYVTEIYSTHTPLTPLANFGVPLPDKMYSITYF